MMAEAKTHSFSLTCSISNIEVMGPDIFISMPLIKKQLNTSPTLAVSPIVTIKGIEKKAVVMMNFKGVVLFIRLGVTKIPKKMNSCRSA